MELKLFLGFKAIFILSIAIRGSVCLTAKEEIQKILALTPSDPAYNSRCAKIDCSRDAFRICVELKLKDSSKKYILNIRKCDMDKIQCFGNMSTREVPMKYCYPYKKKSISGEREAEKEKRVRLAFVPKRVKREIIQNDTAITSGSNNTERTEKQVVNNSTALSLDNSTALRSVFNYPMFQQSMFGGSDEEHVQGKKKRSKTTKKPYEPIIADSSEPIIADSSEATVGVGSTVLSSAEDSSEESATTKPTPTKLSQSDEATGGDPSTVISSVESSSEYTTKPATIVSSEDGAETPCEGKTTPKPTTKKCDKDKDETLKPQKLTTKKPKGNVNANIQFFSRGKKTVFTPDNATIYHNLGDLRRANIRVQVFNNGQKVVYTPENATIYKIQDRIGRAGKKDAGKANDAIIEERFPNGTIVVQVSE